MPCPKSTSMIGLHCSKRSNSISLRKIRARTRRAPAYLSDLSQFLNWYSQTFVSFDLDGVTPTDIRDYREHLQEMVPPLAPATINRRLTALRRFFSWAKENGCTENQPTKRIRNVETTDHGPRSLDRKQWYRLQRSVEQAKGNRGVRDRCIVLLLYHTGLRACS